MADDPLSFLPPGGFNDPLVLGDQPPRCAVGFRQPRLFQLCQRPLHSVGVDTRLGRQLPHRGQLAPRGVDSNENLPGDLLTQLLPDGTILGEFPLHVTPSLYYCIK